MPQALPRRSLPLFVVGMLIGGAAGAQGATAVPGWNLSGFGTVGVVHSSERNADYTSSVMKIAGAGATRAWSIDVDTRLGTQLDLRFDRRWSAVFQVVAEQGLDNSYRPRIEWANLKYRASPDLALRFGRIAVPMFLSADYRKVGYAYPWVRPPVETYGSLPFTSSDGVDATLRWSSGALRNSSQLFFGRDEVELIAPSRASARHIVGISNTSDWDALNLRASLIQAELTTDIGAGLFGALRATGPAGVAIARRLELDHKRASIASVGLNYDPGRWFATFEASRSHTDSLLGANRSMYAAGGMRIKSLTPYLSVARVRVTSPTSDPGLPVAGMPPPVAAQVAQLNQGLNLLLSTIAQQDTYAAGVRWDLAANAALKLQYDRVTPQGGSRGTMINQTPAFRSGRAAHVASVTLDFVY